MSSHRLFSCFHLLFFLSNNNSWCHRRKFRGEGEECLLGPYMALYGGEEVRPFMHDDGGREDRASTISCNPRRRVWPEICQRRCYSLKSEMRFGFFGFKLAFYFFPLLWGACTNSLNFGDARVVGDHWVPERAWRMIRSLVKPQCCLGAPCMCCVHPWCKVHTQLEMI